MGFKSSLNKGDGKDSGLCRIFTGVSRWPRTNPCVCGGGGAVRSPTIARSGDQGGSASLRFQEHGCCPRRDGKGAGWRVVPALLHDEVGDRILYWLLSNNVWPS
jgi:hypothetical protein